MTESVPPQAPSTTGAPSGEPAERPAGLLAHARAARGRVGLAFALFVLVNAVLLGGYLWSRGGQTTTMRLEARGEQFTAVVDGEVRARAQFSAPQDGGIVLGLEDTHGVPTLPQPRGIDLVRVVDLETDEVLFEDGFSSAPVAGEEWAGVSGGFEVDDGVLSVVGPGQLTLGERSWRNYTVEVRFKNVTGGSVLVRADDPTNGVLYAFRPYRHFDNALSLVQGGRIDLSASGGVIQLSRAETIKAMVYMVLQPYPLIAGLLALGFVAVLAFVLVPWPRRLFGNDEGWPLFPWVVAGCIAACAFAVTLYLNYSYGSHLPHVPDEVSYIFQAKLLASGRVAAPEPPVPDSFDFFYPPLIVLSDGHWASVYPFGHSLALAVGVRVGAMWLIPPLLGAAGVVLIFALARRLYNARTGMLAALLLASSPFFLMAASNFMSHNTAVFYLLASLFLLSLVDRRPLITGVAAGLFFGLLFNARPLTTFALIPPFGLLLLSRLVRPEERRGGLDQLAGFIAGGMIMLGIYWLYNYGTTGDPFRNGYQVSGNLDQVFGFGGQHTVAAGIQNELTQLSVLLLVLNGWPLYIGMAAVLLPFMLGTRKLWDWVFLASAVSVMGAYSLFEGHGLMHGPRYWYEATPFLMLLTARGADLAAQRLAGAAASVRGALLGSAQEGAARWAGVTVVYSIVLVFVGAALSGWLFGKQEGWNIDFVPDRAAALKGFNDADDRLLKLVDEAELENALVLVEACAHWQCYGTVFWRNSPDLDSNVVFARDVEGRRPELFAEYPDRRVYVATYVNPSLEPLVPAMPGNEDPRARDVAEITPTPAPTPTVNPLEAGQRDAKRREDLATLTRALQTYHELHGAYPIVEGVQSFCAYPFDIGCAVREVLDPLPHDPVNGATYWYQSDGASFILFAHMEATADPSQCPVPLPGHIAGVGNIECLRGSPPAGP